MNGLDRIEKILKDLAKSQKDTDRRFKETDKRLDARFKETEKSFKETDKRLDARFKETEKSFKETEKLVKELSRNIGGLNNSLGKIPEALSLPQIENDFKKFDIEIFKVLPDAKVRYNGGKETKEVDAILVSKQNGAPLVIVLETQVKYKSIKEIDVFLSFLEEFKGIFEEYKRYKVVGCVCGMRFGTGVDKYAINKGLFTLKPTQGIMSIVNPKNFIPHYV